MDDEIALIETVSKTKSEKKSRWVCCEYSVFKTSRNVLKYMKLMAGN